MSDNELQNLEITQYGDGSKGLILEVDLVYPDELHDGHSDYPERCVVDRGDLSVYCKGIADKYSISVGKIEKLGPNLVHYGNPKLYVGLGLKIRKIDQ